VHVEPLLGETSKRRASGHLTNASLKRGPLGPQLVALPNECAHLLGTSDTIAATPNHCGGHHHESDEHCRDDRAAAHA
jgi:hypothetical protein